jgi:nucleolar protein 15
MKDAPDAEANALKAKKAKAAKSATAPAVEEATEAEAEVEAAQEDSDIEMDDQTAALLQGFESGSEDESPAADAPGYTGEPIPELSKKAKNKLAKLAAQKSVSAGPGTVYLGRIPHGFYEHEMRQYFKQFGDITQLRLSRNRKTGNSKHYAFIQFASADVAEIVSKTMDSYLLFKHILKCKVVPEEQVHASLWEGANKRFKKVPWNKMEGRKLNTGLDEAGWEKRNATETKRREEKKEKLKAIGYEFDAPALKSAKGVPKTPRQKVVVEVEPEVAEAEAEVEKVVVEEPKPVAEVVKAAEPVKESKRKADTTETEEPSKKKQKKVKAKASTDNLKAAAAVEKPVVEKATRPKRAAAAEKKVVEEPVVAAAKPVAAKPTKAKKAVAVVEEKVEKAEKPAKRAKKSKA